MANGCVAVCKLTQKMSHLKVSLGTQQKMSHLRSVTGDSGGAKQGAQATRTLLQTSTLHHGN